MVTLNKAMKIQNKDVLKKLKLCCDSGVTLQDETNGAKLTCPQDLDHESMICNNGDWDKKKWEQVSNETVNPRIQYCIGYSWPTQNVDWYQGLQLTRYGCKKPCNGDTPCIR